MAINEKRYWTEGIEEGRKRERERIIALIKENYDDEDWGFHEASPGAFVYTEDIIDLIQENLEIGTEEDSSNG